MQVSYCAAVVGPGALKRFLGKLVLVAVDFFFFFFFDGQEVSRSWIKKRCRGKKSLESFRAMIKVDRIENNLNQREGVSKLINYS